MLNTANADLILWVYRQIPRAILILKFASSEIKLKGIRVPHQFNLPENMLLLSLILIVADSRHQMGFKLPLDLVVGRSVEIWTPEVENWSNEMWEHVLFHITERWQLLRCFLVTIPDLQKELSDVIDELKRISGGAENISRDPYEILKRTVISGDAETEQAFQILQRWLFPLSNHPSDNEAPSEGSFAIPHNVKKRSSAEFASSPTESPQSKREKEDRVRKG
jgi:hypothetical protein